VGESKNEEEILLKTTIKLDIILLQRKTKVVRELQEKKEIFCVL
jgi:hypothetical protein